MLNVESITNQIGRQVGVSDWITVDQNRINTFADCTDDHQFIHIDPERAARETPFGGAIAHGFLSLSLLSKMAEQAGIALNGAAMGVNYGFDRVRFLHPVAAGKRVRGAFHLKGVEERAPGQWMLTMGVVVDIEGEDRPALAADWLVLQIMDPAAV